MTPDEHSTTFHGAVLGHSAGGQPLRFQHAARGVMIWRPYRAATGIPFARGFKFRRVTQAGSRSVPTSIPGVRDASRPSRTKS